MSFLWQRSQGTGIGKFIALFITLAFFYIWPFCANYWWKTMLSLIQEYDLKVSHFYLYWNLFQAVSVSIIMHTFFLICYVCEFEFIERYNVSNEPWPWKSKDKTEQAEWNTLLKKTIALYSFNLLVIGPLAIAPIIIFDLPLGNTSPNGIPSRKAFIMQLIFCVIIEDFLFHMSHRLLHYKKIYPYIHKIHHQHRVTISISAIYAHPLEFVFGNLVPMVAGPMILHDKMHIASIFTWYFLRTVSTLDGHSGYEFSWSPYNQLPWLCDSGYHNYHHLNNIGNFSSFFTFWDTILGSNKSYYAFLNEQKEIKNNKKTKVQ